jgi:hypothetical protein
MPRLVTTGLDPVVHADSQRVEAIHFVQRTRRMDCRVIGGTK